LAWVLCFEIGILDPFVSFEQRNLAKRLRKPRLFRAIQAAIGAFGKGGQADGGEN
jgi:hypothetical protein